MNIYELKNRLNKLYNKIETIGGLNYDTTYIKKEFNSLNEKLDNVFDTNSSQLELTKKDTMALTSISALISHLEDYIDKIYKKFAIYDDARKVAAELNNDISQNKLNSIVELILNDALEYMDLYNSDYKNGKEDELYVNLYKIIKCEYRIKGSSTLLPALTKMSVCINEIKSLIDKDVKENLDKEDIYKRYNEVLSLNGIDETMVYLLSLNENGYKNTILSALDETKKEYDESEKSYEKQQLLKKDKLNSPTETFSHLRKSVFKALRVFIPNIVSIAILIGANNALHTSFKKSANYKTTAEVYDTVLGKNQENIYTKLTEDQVLIRVYEGEDKDKYRKYTDYVVDKQDIPIEEYENVELRKSYITNTGTKHSSFLDYDSETETIKKIFIPESFDYNDTDRSILLEILVHLLLFFGWGLLDMLGALLFESAHQQTGNLAFTIAYKDEFLEALNEIMNEYKAFIEGLNTKENGYYDKEEYLKIKSDYEKTKNEYEKLLQEFSKYEKLLDYNGYTRRLK